MLPGLIAALLSVGLGILLGLRAGSRRWIFQPLRAFALAAVLFVVLTHLLPEGLELLGIWGLVAFLAGWLVPGLLARLLGDDHHGSTSLHVTYAGLALHQVADGLALGAFAGALHPGEGNYDLIAAVMAHTTPVTALIIHAYDRHGGQKLALKIGVGLASAMVTGVLISTLGGEALLGSLEPWITCAAAGLLVHVLLSHHGVDDEEAVPSSRLAELVSVTLGVALPLLAGGLPGHDHPGTATREAVMHAFGQLCLDTAPALLLGFIAATAFTVGGGRIPLTWLRSGSNLRQAIRGAVVGAPIPICSCGVLPVASSLRARDAGPAFVVAFLLATPELGIETFALTVHFLGWEMAWLRLGAALLVAIVAALVVSRFSPATTPGEAGCCEILSPSSAPLFQRLMDTLDDLLLKIGPWILMGLIAAAYIEVMVPADGLGSVNKSGLDIVLVTLVAIPGYICASSATPLAAVLIAKGMSPGAALAGLLLGPATNIATIGFLRNSFGNRATVVGLLALIGSAWVIAAVLNVTPLELDLATAGGHHGDPHILSLVCAGLVGVMLVWNLARHGLDNWLHILGFGGEHV